MPSHRLLSDLRVGSWLGDHPESNQIWWRVESHGEVGRVMVIKLGRCFRWGLLQIWSMVNETWFKDPLLSGPKLPFCHYFNSLCGMLCSPQSSHSKIFIILWTSHVLSWCSSLFTLFLYKYPPRPHCPSGEIVRSNVVFSIQSLLGILVDFLISTLGLYYIYIWNTNTLYCICLYVKFSNKISLKSGMMESHSSSNIYYWHTMHIQYVLEEKKKIKVIQWEILLS